MSECIPVAKVCDNCACYEVCIYANPGRKKDCSLWKPDMSWVPVSERLPDHFGVFIVAIREPYKERVGKDCADFDPFAKTWLPSLCWDKGYKVTHWMELPEPPKEASDV